MSNFGWSLNVKVWGKDIIDFSIFYRNKNGGSLLMKFKKPVFFVKTPTFGYLISRIVLKKKLEIFWKYMVKSKINKSYFSERFLFSITQPSFVYKHKKKSKSRTIYFFFQDFLIWTEPQSSRDVCELNVHLSSDFPYAALKIEQTIT